MRKLVLPLIISSLIFGCATSGKPSLRQVLNNEDSMTKSLESLDKRLSVELLASGIQEGGFERTVSLNLRNTPVIVAITTASNDSPYFVDILKHAKTKPIGKILFAKDSLAKRKKLVVSKTRLSQIDNITARTYIARLGYTDDDLIYRRTSIFYYQDQSMQVTEYILPSIKQFTD